MRRKQVGGASEYNSDINVTPMVDVMLVLLIIFMIVTPLLQQGVSVNLPKEMLSPDPDPDIAKDTSVIVAIPDNNNFFIGKSGDGYEFPSTPNSSTFPLLNSGSKP
jgi:biopolymer transport protein ExbD/biopolymer transport protein TolR